MGLKIAKVTDARTSAEFKIQANRAYDAGDLEKAATNLIAALDLNPNDGEGFLQVSTVLTELGRFDKAVIAAKRAAEILPYEPDCYNVLGVALHSVGWFRAAERCFGKTLEFKPDHKSASENRVECVRMIREGKAEEEPPELAGIYELLSVRPPRISLCMIVKNEEQYLAECLESVQGAVDEICIVDTGSSDSTVEIAKRFGAKMGYFEWCGDFAAARNVSIDLATGDWILVLDADEVITPETKDELRRVAMDKTKIGYACIIENLLGDKVGDGKQLAMIFRFFQNRAGMRYEGIIHEQMLPSAQRTGLPNEVSRIRIVHKGYLKKCVTDRNKNNRNLDILIEQEKQEPGNPYCHFNLGQTYKMVGRPEESEIHYKIALDILKEQGAANTIPYYASLYFGYTELLRERGRFDEALTMANEGLEKFPMFADLLFTKGNVFLGMERYDDAMRIYEETRKFAGQVFAGGTDPGVSTYKATNAVGVCYAKMGKGALAKQYLKRAVKEWPTPNSEIHTNLGVIYLNEDESAKALDHLTTALEIDSTNFQAWLNLGSICFKANNIPEAVASWQRALELQPATPDLHFLIGEALLRMGKVEGCIPMLEAELLNRPDHSSSAVALGLALLLQGKNSEGVRFWRTFIEEHPSEPRNGEFKSGILFGKLMIGLAVTEAEVQETDLAPHSIVAQWQGFLDLALKCERFDEVERAATGASDLSGALPGIDEGIGRVFLKWNTPDLAIDFMLRQQKRQPENPEIYFQLGEACMAMGAFEDALVMYQSCMDLNPQHAIARLRSKAAEAQVKSQEARSA